MCTEGRGTVAYVIDTGVRVDHEQFEVPSRVVVSRNFSADRIDMVSTNEADATNACMTIVQGVNDQASLSVGMVRPWRQFSEARKSESPNHKSCLCASRDAAMVKSRR